MLISTNQESEHYLIGNPLSKKKKKPATATTTDTTFQSTRTKNIRKKEKKNLPRVCCHFFSLVFILLFPPLKNLYFFEFYVSKFARACPTSNYQVISRPFCIIFHIYQTSCECTWKKKTIPRQKEVEEDQKTDLNTTIFSAKTTSIESSSKISSSNTASLYSVKISRNQEKSKQHKTNNMPRRNKKGGKGK